jgi:Tol biopolymer transport system component
VTGSLARATAASLAAVVGALSGCGRVSDWSLGEGVVAGCADAADIACVPFGAPTVVAELEAPNGAYDEKPTLTASMLELYFLSNRDGGPGSGDVWCSTRATPTDPWSAPQLVGAVSGPSRETSPAVSSDGTTLWIGSDRDGGLGGLDIWVSARGDAGSDGGWSDPVPVTELNTAGDEIPRPPGARGLVMLLSYRPDPDASYHMYSASRAEAVPFAVWSAPESVASVNTSGLDDDGFLTDDGLTLYFSSDRLNGTQDLFVTERSDPSSPFRTPISLASLNTDTYDERDPWVSPDGHEIYFTSDRLGQLHIFHATR